MYLNCHSWFSFHYGILSVEALLAEARKLGIRKLVLTDINNTSGILDFIRLAPGYDIQPVAGIEFRNGHTLEYICIAANNDGYEEINRFLSACLKQGALHGKSSGNRDAIVPPRPPAFDNVWVIYPWKELPPLSEDGKAGPLRIRRGAFMKKPPERKKKPAADGKQTLRENEFIGIRPSDLTRVPLTVNPELLEHAVVLWPATFRNKQDHNVHRLLTAIGDNTLLSKVPPEHFADANELFVPVSDIRDRYKNFPQLIENTERLLAQSDIAFDFKTSKNKQTFTGSTELDYKVLEKETLKGMLNRYGDSPSEEIRQRVEKELGMIKGLGFAAYFLINWDILKYAQRKGYFYVGRGSGANSIVAYCLRITDVDPIELDLYFERFINPHRTNPPDFDLDFSWKDRDDITQYIFRRHGYEHTALLGTYTTYQSNAVIRELGKVFGLPAEEIDALQQTRDGETVGKDLGGLIRRYSALLHDFPHHLSIHAGGILISEKPISYFTSFNHPPKGFPVTQFSMLEAEDVGLYKFDILSQRGLGHIRDAVSIVKENRGIDIDIHDIPKFKEDEKVKVLIREGRCIGCFYVESPAMRMLLRKLHVDTYIQLVAASSIIRPGVARSGMMKEYIVRTHDKSKRTYIHPVMETLMEETYGIMVYQEDVIKVAHHFAGLDLSEADVLRRGMSGKFRSREQFTKIRDRFFSNCDERGYAPEITAEVWRQIESFAGYSFSKGHSASYAVESYQSLYLKAYYPLEFMVAVINNFGGFYSTEFYVHEARMLGADIHPPHINKSDYVTSIRGTDIYLGFIHMNGLQQSLAEQIVEERLRNGDYTDLSDFMGRISIELEQLRMLIRIGAFNFTGRTKKQLLWDIHLHIGHEKKTVVKKELFPAERVQFQLPQLDQHELDDAYDEIEILGFPLISPFRLIPQEMRMAGEPGSRAKAKRASDLHLYIGQEIEITGYLVTIKPTRTIRGESMSFGCFLDEDGYFFDTTHFPRIAKEYPFRGRGCYRIYGKVDEEFDFCSITVTRMEKIPTGTR